jgi:hypothetical protein
VSEPSATPLATDVRPASGRWLATCECQKYAVTRSEEAGWDWVLSHPCAITDG